MMKLLLKILALMVFISLTLAPKFALAELPEHGHSGVCEYQEFKLHKYGKKLSKWKSRLEICRMEAEIDESKSCFYEVKYKAYFSGKVVKWHGRLEKCKEWYDESL